MINFAYKNILVTYSWSNIYTGKNFSSLIIYILKKYICEWIYTSNQLKLEYHINILT